MEALGLALLLAGACQAQLAQQAAGQPNGESPDAAALDTIEVRSKREPPLADRASSSQGEVSGHQVRALALQRPGDVLEQVPGLVVTQHAGDGKANQYFLRGFNLDHGTDFSVHVAGVPVNLPSHAHGQGYADLNFLIPELIERIAYRKGPYYADDGDFSSAGSARIDYVRRLDAPFLQLSAGRFGHGRGLLAGSRAWGRGDLLYAVEAQYANGPWEIAENLRRLNAVLRYSEGTGLNGFSLTAMAYQGRWRSTDQIPQRAIYQGLLSPWGSLDASDGGQTQRLSLSAQWARQAKGIQERVEAWVLQSKLRLWSNFQYCLNDIAASGQCASGDQFMQAEERVAAGLTASQARLLHAFGREQTLTVGMQARSDHLAPVGLYSTAQRALRSIIREDRIRQHSLALWVQADVRWNSHWRSIIGLRADHQAFGVSSNLAANSGRAQASLVSPKWSLVYEPSTALSLYLNYGEGFHSNDARGTTISVDPAQPAQRVDQVPPLVRTRGLEWGLRARPLPAWQTSLSLWQLRAASELVFVGDAGTTQASRPSKRQGIEWSNRLELGRGLRIQADLAWSRARFVDRAPEGPYVPGAVMSTAHIAAVLAPTGPWSGAISLRHIGPRPLLADNSLRSAGSAVASLRIGYRLSPNSQLTLDVHNLFNRRFNDIEYAYLSQLPGEAAPVMDRHVHPGEPRAVRLTLTHRF